jgi:DNA primase
LSPFSDERSPSLWFHPLKGFGKILVLERNSVAFVMEHEHFTYPEAIRYLARKYNIEIEERNK